ncbi:sulfate transporter family-domain-containing protein [Cladochytrium replicatum]|nr:sulfate transporter family-domain-containing protein [Cladochytrium replicatum]
MVYSFLGTSRQLAVGPEALVCILTGAAITEYVGSASEIHPDSSNWWFGDDDTIPGSPVDRVAERIAAANLIGLIVGLFTSSLGFFRLGFLDSVLSRALLRGFVTAVAVVVGIDMSNTLLGIKLDTGHLTGDDAPSNPSPIEHLLHVIKHLDSTHTLTAVISLISISFFLSMRMLKHRYKSVRWFQMIPEILLLVVTSTFCAYMFRWDLGGVDVLKDVPGGFVPPRLIPARTSVGKIKSAYAGKHNYTVSPNRELVALGRSSIFGSMFGGWPAFGSLGRSAVNDGAGAKTQFAGFVTGCVIGAICSSIIFVAALKLIEAEDFHFIFELRAWGDMGLLLLTFLTTLFISIEAGTLISVGVSLLLVLKHCTKTRISIMGQTAIVDHRRGTVKTKYRAIPTGSVALSDVEAHPDGSIEEPLDAVQGTLIIRIEEGLFFGNTGQLLERLNRIEMMRRTQARRLNAGTPTSAGTVGVLSTPVNGVPPYDIGSLNSPVNVWASDIGIQTERPSGRTRIAGIRTEEEGSGSAADEDLHGDIEDGAVSLDLDSDEGVRNVIFDVEGWQKSTQALYKFCLKL